MKKNILRKQSVTFILAIAVAAMMAGCGTSEEGGRESSNAPTTAGTVTSTEQDSSSDTVTGAEDDGDVPAGATSLEVRFGDEGESFVMQLEDNTAAAAIARHVGTADWRLPIYNYDGYDNWEVMQYYDIPSRYEIPSHSETVTSETAGEVYYSEPNRIVLFYQDGQVTGEYTKIGTIENTEEFREAVESNPVLEGWGNKIVHIKSME